MTTEPTPQAVLIRNSLPDHPSIHPDPFQQRRRHGLSENKAVPVGDPTDECPLPIATERNSIRIVLNLTEHIIHDAERNLTVNGKVEDDHEHGDPEEGFEIVLNVVESVKVIER